jgi:hypothetical protein
MPHWAGRDRVKGTNVADEEPVVAPDQLKPGFSKSSRIGGIVTIVALLLMVPSNHDRTGSLWLLGIAALIAAALVGGAVMRRRGLRS